MTLEKVNVAGSGNVVEHQKGQTWGKKRETNCCRPLDVEEKRTASSHRWFIIVKMETL